MAMIYNFLTTHTFLPIYNLRPRRPPFLLVESEGIGVTSSMRPIFIAERASARRADWAPGPGVFVLFPPVARSLMWRAVIPRDLHFSATSYIQQFKLFIYMDGKLEPHTLAEKHRWRVSENKILWMKMKCQRTYEFLVLHLNGNCYFYSCLNFSSIWKCY